MALTFKIEVHPNQVDHWRRFVMVVEPVAIVMFQWRCVLMRSAYLFLRVTTLALMLSLVLSAASSASSSVTLFIFEIAISMLNVSLGDGKIKMDLHFFRTIHVTGSAN